MVSTIRQEQLAIFSEVELKKFEDRMVVHLNKFFPKQCEAAGELQLRDTIRYGIKRAATHGITWERDVCKYIDLMIVFGRDFHQDKRLPWAGQILNTRNSPSVRMAVLLRAAEKHLTRA